jgi:hypothetical protein
MLETQEKVGDVRRTPFGALKRICEENSMFLVQICLQDLKE